MNLIFPTGFAIIGTIGIYSFWNMAWAMQYISIAFLILIILYSTAIEWIKDVLSEKSE
jgi:hypothetical protein